MNTKLEDGVESLINSFVKQSTTRPETNIAPENRPPPIGKYYSNHPFSGAMLVSESAGGRFKHVYVHPEIWGR